jgi:hypothetical protein
MKEKIFFGILALSLIGLAYISYGVGKIAAYESIAPTGDILWKTQATTAINQDHQNIATIVKYLQLHPFK